MVSNIATAGRIANITGHTLAGHKYQSPRMLLFTEMTSFYGTKELFDPASLSPDAENRKMVVNIIVVTYHDIHL
jgi:hypothetical protein